MSYDYTDAWGSVSDTGQASARTARANTETELHRSGETDTGSSLTVNAGSTVSTTAIPHFQNHRPTWTVR